MRLHWGRPPIQNDRPHDDRQTDTHKAGHSDDRAEVVVIQVQARGCQLPARQQKLPKGKGWDPVRYIRTIRQHISIVYMTWFVVCYYRSSEKRLRMITRKSSNYSFCYDSCCSWNECHSQGSFLYIKPGECLCSLTAQEDVGQHSIQ